MTQGDEKQPDGTNTWFDKAKHSLCALLRRQGINFAFLGIRQKESAPPMALCLQPVPVVFLEIFLYEREIVVYLSESALSEAPILPRVFPPLIVNNCFEHCRLVVG